MGKIGFDIENEFIPSFDKFQNDMNKRLMFLKLFNQEVSCALKFSKQELKNCKSDTLFDIFTKKILKNLKHDSYVKTPIVNIDVNTSFKIQSFISKYENITKTKYSNFSMLNTLEESDIETSIKLIDFLEDSNFSFYLDGETIFKNFVSKKILRSNVNKSIKVDEESIEIKSEEHYFNTKIFTFWQFLDSKKLDIDTHIQKAVDCIETSEFNQVYLVYPKTENFNKHIKINCDEKITAKEYEIKLIPYSMRSTLR